MKNFKELIKIATKKSPKKCVVVSAEDETVLEGVKKAQNLGLISAILIGDKNEIFRCAKKVGLDLKNTEIHHEADQETVLKKSISIVREQGNFLMKGMLDTVTFLKGILNKDWGLRTGKILSHIAALEIPAYHKLIFMSDGGMNPTLDLRVRIDIINNAIETLAAIGIKKPKIGLIASSETINPDMPETVDAKKIVEMNQSGAIKGIIEGPFGFDVAISKKAALQKRLKSEIAGDVDFLLMPNISAANIWAKGLIYFAKAKAAGMVAGAARPVIMLSRADEPDTKLNSIALGVAISEN